MSLRDRLRTNKYVRDARTFPAAARAAWRRGGARGVKNELRQRTLDRVWERGSLWVVEQDLSVARDVSPPDGVKIELLVEAALEELRSIASGPTLDRLRRAIARDRTYLVARRAGRAIAYGCISRSLDPDLEGYPLSLPAGTAYLWDLYVVPQERNRRVGSAMAAARVRHAKAAGFHRAWRVVDPRTPEALRTLERSAGAAPHVIGEIRALKIWRRRWARFHPSAPRPLLLPE